MGNQEKGQVEGRKTVMSEKTTEVAELAARGIF
jgi:hypothetical protein